MAEIRLFYAYRNRTTFTTDLVWPRLPVRSEKPDSTSWMCYLFRNTCKDGETATTWNCSEEILVLRSLPYVPAHYSSYLSISLSVCLFMYLSGFPLNKQYFLWRICEWNIRGHFCFYVLAIYTVNNSQTRIEYGFVTKLTYICYTFHLYLGIILFFECFGLLIDSAYNTCKLSKKTPLSVTYMWTICDIDDLFSTYKSRAQP